MIGQGSVRREGGAVRAAWAVTAIVAVCLGGAAPAGMAQSAEAPSIMPLDEVHPGMTGYGLTVLHGTAIERFDTRILGILRGGPASDLILFRASGPVIQESGGTASGMSGSPIYVNGRIIGALSFGYHFAGPDSDLSLATPIEQMLKALAPPSAGTGMPQPRLYRAGAPLATPRGLVDRVIVMDSTADASAYNARPLPDTIAVAPVAVPVVASGLTPAALGVLSRTLHRFNVVPRQTYGGRKVFPTPPVAPGSSLGVELVRGDVEVGAIGTLTYRRGDQIVAFGHPLLNAGTVSVLLTSAWIDTVVRSLDFPFKEGSLGEIVGMATEDRAVGIGGQVGRFPRTFGVRVSVRDKDRGTARTTLGVQVVRRKDLAEGLVPMAVLSLVQRIMDRTEGGSAKVKLVLRAKAVPHEIVREDLAFDTSDIATASVLDVPTATQLLFGNFFRDIDPIDMAVDVEVSSQPNSALLVRARPSARTVHPGGSLEVTVGLRPFGGASPFTRVVEFAIPPDFPPGPAFLLVGAAGAPSNPAPPSQLFDQLVLTEGTPPAAASLDAAIDGFEHSGKNTEVLVELVPDSVLTAAGSNANPGFDASAGTSIPTEWVVLGRFQIPIMVK